MHKARNNNNDDDDDDNNINNNNNNNNNNSNLNDNFICIVNKGNRTEWSQETT